MRIPPGPAPASNPSSGETVGSSSPGTPPADSREPTWDRVPHGALPCTPSASRSFLEFPLQ